MRPELLHILQHSIGVDQYGQGPQYRNHFVAGGDDVAKCRELVSLGFMWERDSHPLSGGSPVFHVTREGISAVSDHSPRPPKLTRGQQRYRDYREVADCFESFGDYLRYQAAKNKQASAA